MIQNFWHTGVNKFKDFFDSTKSKLKEWASAFKEGISGAMDAAKSKVSSAISGMQGVISGFASSAQSLLSRVASAVSSAASKVKSAVSSALSSSASLTNAKARSVSLRGHATGGIFNREHIAHIAEGNKAEAIIPLQDKTAMQPFVDAVSSGLAQYLGPVMANMNNGSNNEPMVAAADNSLPPLYVGTLIADESSLRELQRKLNVIQLHETRRTI
jgi:SLT domain-containing protein